MNDIRGKCDLLRSDCKYMESVARDLMKVKFHQFCRDL